MSFSTILDWIKQYLVIVICIVVIIVALVGLPMVSTGWNEDVRKLVKDRDKQFQKIDRLEKTNFQVPGSRQSHTTVINQKLLEEYGRITDAMREDAQQVTQRALVHNQKNHDVLMPELFPEPPEGHGAMDVMPRQYHEKLTAAYEALLKSVNAGEPPSPEDVETRLHAASRQFLEQMMAKDESDTLTEEEEKQLQQQMTGERLEIYRDHAADIGVYLSMDVLGPPYFDQSAPPTLPELFHWQWRYWVLEELASVIKSVNGDRSEVMNPLKRVEFIQIYGLMEMSHTAGKPVPGAPPTPPGGSSGAPGGGRFGGGTSPRAGGGGRGGGAPGPPGGGGGGGSSRPTAPSVSAPPSGSTNYDVSLSGRISNELYDVVTVELDLVVESASIPEVLDAFARQNFMTVLDLGLKPADAYEAIKDGYFYGGENVASLHLVVEMVFLRAWTKPYMPDEVRSLLGIASQTPNQPIGGAGGPGGPGGPGSPGGPGAGGGPLPTGPQGRPGRPGGQP